MHSTPLKPKTREIATALLALIIALSTFATTALAAYTASDWAKPEIDKAQSYGLIPDALKDADLTKPITRAEFAAIAIKTYENFTGTAVSPVATNPFTDTTNPDVLKAYNINIVNGTTATTYNPNGILTREQAATMLTRVEKKAYIPGWTLVADSAYTLNFKQPAKFSDDNKISDYAKTSVYFMNAKGVINGTGNNNLSPAVTATRQEAIIIAVRMVEKLKGNALDYTQEGTTQPPSTGDNAVSVNALAGVWVTTGWADVYWWEFGANGSFAYYRGTISASVSYWDEYLLKGKYRVNGNTIECYDCQFDSFEQHSLSGNDTRNHKYFGDDKRRNMPDNLMLTTRLQDPKNANSFSFKFEFINAMTLRIVTDGKSFNIESNDCDFDYHADYHNVNIPTHSLPAAAWPKDILPSDLPEYRNGRIRSVEPMNEPGYEVRIWIDKTTPEDVKDYIYNLINQEGWELLWIKEDELQYLLEHVSDGRFGFNLHKPGEYMVAFDVGKSSFFISF